jgi:protocatechuate 3,4-dioxygenase, beta subunit
MLTWMALLLLQLPSCEWCGVTEAPRNLTSTALIAGASEPGERMILTGRILRDGKPVPNVILYAWHTNNEGIYPKRGNERGNAQRHGYLRGWLRTDAQGRFRIESIRPAMYPTNNAAAHIHLTAGEPGKPEVSVGEFQFAGDPLAHEGRNVLLVTLTKSNGVWRGSRDIVLH